MKPSHSTYTIGSDFSFLLYCIGRVLDIEMKLLV